MENTGDGDNIVAKLVQEPYTIYDLYVSGTEQAQVISVANRAGYGNNQL